MKNCVPKYAIIGFLLLFLPILAFSQSNNLPFDPTSVPVEESGISIEEYNDIKSNTTFKLFSTEGKLTLTLTKVQGSTNDPGMKHSFVQMKDNPNRPEWSAIPYTIIREEDCDENK
jgi:hypothetical protein